MESALNSNTYIFINVVFPTTLGLKLKNASLYLPLYLLSDVKFVTQFNFSLINFYSF